MSVLQVCLFAALAATTHSAQVSPVQKVVELLEQCKAKVQKDLAAEAKEMEEYTTFCDTELEEKGYAIKTAERTITELTADVADNQAVIETSESEIADTGAVLAEKDGEMASAAAERKTSNEGFVASEKEMIESIDELAGAVNQIKGAGAAFLQGKAGSKLRSAVSALSEVVKAGRLDFASHKRLHSLLQAAEAEKEDSDDLLRSAPKADAFESGTGGIMATLEDMQKKAEDGLSELRKKEMEDTHSFDMVKQNLENEQKNLKEKLALATKTNAEAKEKSAQAESELVQTKKTKAADEEYSTSLKMECETAAREWGERQASAKEEMQVIEKAKEILVSGVKALVQVSSHTKSRRWGEDDEQVTSAETREDTIRVKLGSFLKKLARQQKSFALAQLASVSAADPFVKIRGLIEEMISKLVAEAQEEATQKAFCDEEMGKSKASKEEKEGLVEKHSSRLEEAESRTAQLTESIKQLEAEIAEIDKSQTEATKLRGEEKAAYDVASKDFRDSAEAVARAIAVLKNYYEGAALVQVARPKFGSAKGDAGGSIISILEMAQEDFTTLLAEAEETEDVAVESYEKLTQENAVARASKEAEAKAAASELKSLKVTIENSKEDKASTTAELDAIIAYIEKLKPQCESKVMSYAERKAAREAEIEGLKNALQIIEGKGM